MKFDSKLALLIAKLLIEGGSKPLPWKPKKLFLRGGFRKDRLGMLLSVIDKCRLSMVGGCLGSGWLSGLDSGMNSSSSMS